MKQKDGGPVCLEMANGEHRNRACAIGQLEVFVFFDWPIEQEILRRNLFPVITVICGP